MRPSRLLAVLLPTALLATACSSGADTSEFVSGDDYSVTSALAQVPSGSGRMFVTADLTAATEAAGLQRPTDFTTDAVTSWLMPLTQPTAEDAPPVFVPMAQVFNLNHAAQMADFDAELGWSLLDVDAFVESSLVPNTFAVVTGSGLALNPDLPEVDGDVVTAGEGEDLQVNLESATAARPTGVPLRMALSGDRLAASPSTPAVKNWQGGPKTSMADDESLAAVAGALDDADVVSAVVDGTDSFSLETAFGGQASPEAVEALTESVPADPFDAIGVGWGVEDGNSRITIAYHFGDEAAAEAAIPVFEKQYAESRTLRSSQPMGDSFTLVDTAANGPVTVLTVEPNGAAPGIMWSWYSQRELTFLHQ